MLQSANLKVKLRKNSIIYILVFLKTDPKQKFNILTVRIKKGLKDYLNYHLDKKITIKKRKKEFMPFWHHQ
jgi:hypothetical protein